MPFPDIDPVLIQIGPIAIRWYALAYVAGFLLGWRYAVRLMRQTQLWGAAGPPANEAQVDDLMLWVTLGVIVGGRLGHVFFYTPQIILTDPVEILKTWHGGMSFHGGTIGVIVAIVGFSLVNKIDMLRLADLVAPAVPFGLFFGRIANFINGELWGRPTTLPWGVVFPGAGPLPRHPSQLYEAALEGVVLFLILLWATRKAGWLQRRGAVTGLFLVGYGIFRIFVETLREPDSYLPLFPFGLTMGMMLSVPMVIAGVIMIALAFRGPAPEPGRP
jgi:phosphatidylglycerol:prolipoprotein diacylglycerol transferase